MNTVVAQRDLISGVMTRHTRLIRAIGALCFALLIGVGASVRIPLPWTPVPITLQTFVLLLGSACLTRHYALQMMGWYLTLGVCGAPLFAGGASGWGVIVGPTSGYLFGFLLAAWWIGYGQSRVGTLWTQVLLFLTASLWIFLCGAIWLGLSSHLGLQQTLIAGVYPFLPGDLLKVLTAALLVQSGKRLLKNVT